MLGHGVALIRRKANDSYRGRSRWEQSEPAAKAGFLLIWIEQVSLRSIDLM
jgi:hypothetical protein